MSSLLTAVTGTADETEPSRGTEQRHETTDGGSGGSRRRVLGLAAAGLGTAYLLRRRRARTRRSERRDDTRTSTGELDASRSASGDQGRSVRGRLVRTVAGIAAGVVVRRAIRRWRKR